LAKYVGNCRFHGTDLLLCLSIGMEDAARTVNITRKTRRDGFGQGTARLQQASGAAVSSILKILLDPHAPASTKLRAADLVLTHGARAIEIEDIEARLTELERAAEEKKNKR
jgi:hypothetical protein